MFGMVVVFGLYHGLIFLPVLLSLVGPQSSPMSEAPIESPVSESKEEAFCHNSPISTVSPPDLEKR